MFKTQTGKAADGGGRRKPEASAVRVTFIIENINHIHLAAKQPNTANKQLSPLSPGQSAPFER